jgi:hypothetical protein
MQFDYNNPWHREIDLYCGLTCRQCGVTVWIGEYVEGGVISSFEGECVAFVEYARGLGWRLADNESTFLCPECAKPEKST